MHGAIAAYIYHSSLTHNLLTRVFVVVPNKYFIAPSRPGITADHIKIKTRVKTTQDRRYAVHSVSTDVYSLMVLLPFYTHHPLLTDNF